MHYKNYLETISKISASKRNFGYIRDFLHLENIVFFGISSDKKQFSESRLSRMKIMYAFVHVYSIMS